MLRQQVKCSRKQPIYYIRSLVEVKGGAPSTPTWAQFTVQFWLKVHQLLNVRIDVQKKKKTITL